MFSATQIATAGSSQSQPVSEPARCRPPRRPTSRHRSSKWRPSASSAIDRCTRGCAQHQPGQHAVQDRRRHRQRQAPADRLQRLRIEQPLHRRPQNRARCKEDQQAFEAGREILGFEVPIGMVRVGRSRRDRHHRERERRAGKVHERLHRIRQQPDRAGQLPGEGLQRDREKRDAQRGDQQALRRCGLQPARGGRRPASAAPAGFRAACFMRQGRQRRRVPGHRPDCWTQASTTRANRRLPTCTTWLPASTLSALSLTTTESMRTPPPSISRFASEVEGARPAASATPRCRAARRSAALRESHRAHRRVHDSRNLLRLHARPPHRGNAR